MADTETHAAPLPAAQVTGSWTPDGETIALPSETALLDAIATIYDPEIPVNIYEPGCPSAQELPVQVREAVLGVPGVTDAEVETVWDPPWDPSRMTEEARLALNMF
jgi:metal-sulfur cluster biosynthetic enzyme